MQTITISLKLPENVKEFVKIASRYNFDVDLRSGRYVVDAKSLLGIFSLDLAKPITVEIYGEDCDEFIETVKSFMI